MVSQERMEGRRADRKGRLAVPDSPASVWPSTRVDQARRGRL